MAEEADAAVIAEETEAIALVAPGVEAVAGIVETGALLLVKLECLPALYRSEELLLEATVPPLPSCPNTCCCCCCDCW